VSFDCALDLADDTDATIDQAVDLQPVDSITSVASFFVSRLDAKPTRCIPPARRYRADRSSQRPLCLRALAPGASPAKDGTRWHAQAPSRSRRCGRAPPLWDSDHASGAGTPQTGRSNRHAPPPVEHATGRPGRYEPVGAAEGWRRRQRSATRSP
jgi:hypothetical protein